MKSFSHEPGKLFECLCLSINVQKKQYIDDFGQITYKIGFRIGGGIDQDRTKAPFQYPDCGIYVTYVEPGSPADKAGLKQHDKLLEVNGKDFTMVTHEKAVKYIRKDMMLNILLTRPEVAFLTN